MSNKLLTPDELLALVVMHSAEAHCYAVGTTSKKFTLELSTKVLEHLTKASAAMQSLHGALRGVPTQPPKYNEPD